MVERRRIYQAYSESQQARWQSLDMVNTAMTYGWAAMLRPSPYFSADKTQYEAWKRQVVDRWKQESGRDASTTSPGLADIPEHLWLWWYEAMGQTKALPLISPRPDTFDE